jgi:O-Antigen ligase
MATTVLLTRLPDQYADVHSTGRRPLLERAVCAYFEWLPILWLCGLILPLAFLIFFPAIVVFGRSRRALFYALPWFAVGIAQYISVLVNWTQSHEPAIVLLKHLVAGYVSGWLLLGAAVGVGASGIVDPERLLRSIARVSYYTILLAVPAYMLALYLPFDSLFLVSPVGHLVPATFASRNFAFGIFVYNWEDFGGSLFPRLSLLSPWPTAMGAAGVCMTFIGLNLKGGWERRGCIAGGILMVLSSMGRLSLLTLVICLLVRWIVGWNRPYQICLVYSTLLVVVVGLLLVKEPDALLKSFMDGFNETRPGASEVRNEVYEANWKGFSEAPWLGHGWPGEPLATEHVYGTDGGMVVGSHSTVSGLLYKGGIVTFGLFVMALVCTIVGLLRQKNSRWWKNNLMITLAIGLTCFGEGLESLVLPMLFAFVWIGASLARPGVWTTGHISTGINDAGSW